ncbi:MAG: hypothetical protein A2V66_15745 [Ignavibacteria bacterium RBG_13_36_8]|nr:MAG: hypothetical protein A2V66_15745 [Ignavibacteria bacterium RBG_13_36_8]
MYDPIFLKHDQPEHPEGARRLKAIMSELKSAGLLDKMIRVKTRAATEEELQYAHPKGYIEYVKNICKNGGGYLDPDTYTTSSSYEAASIAAGSLIDLTLKICSGELKNGFAFIRPPGHHALAERAMGFCIFANVVIAARAAQKKCSIGKVAIVDFDVHHGNGTQAILYDDPSVLYVSTHQYPYYPGTGSANEIGHGKGEGTTINFPLPPGSGDENFKKLFNDILSPVLDRFKPGLIIVSAGYDCHWQDPLASLGLSLTGLAWISQFLVKKAEELCSGKIVFALEGGYNLEVLKKGTANSIKALMGENDFEDQIGKSPEPEATIENLLSRLKTIHKL